MFLLKDLRFQDSNLIKCSTCIQFVLTEILDSACTLSQGFCPLVN